MNTGRLFSVTYDNLVRTDKKEEETLTNRKIMRQYTSGYIDFLYNPDPSIFPPNIVEPWFVDAHRALIEGMQAEPGIGAPRSLLYNPDPDFSTLLSDPYSFLSSQSIEAHPRTTVPRY